MKRGYVQPQPKSACSRETCDASASRYSKACNSTRCTLPSPLIPCTPEHEYMYLLFPFPSPSPFLFSCSPQLTIQSPAASLHSLQYDIYTTVVTHKELGRHISNFLFQTVISYIVYHLACTSYFMVNSLYQTLELHYPPSAAHHIHCCGFSIKCLSRHTSLPTVNTYLFWRSCFLS